VPNDPAFQPRVMMAAFALLDAPEALVIVDYPAEAPEETTAFDAESMAGMVCPVDFPKPADPDAPTSEIGVALMKEIAALAPWYDLAVRMRGRTTVGPSGLEIEDAGKYLASFLGNQAAAAPRDDMPAGRVLKLAYEDLKAYYAEAVTAQPGAWSSHKVENWLFGETALGKALWTLRDICRASDDDYHQFLGRNSIVPDRQINPAH